MLNVGMKVDVGVLHEQSDQRQRSNHGGCRLAIWSPAQARSCKSIGKGSAEIKTQHLMRKVKRIVFSR
jgi:hypothetical protein